jgi:cytoskeletal protein CcmA (bactofilin family)
MSTKVSPFMGGLGIDATSKFEIQSNATVTVGDGTTTGNVVVGGKVGIGGTGSEELYVNGDIRAQDATLGGGNLTITQPTGYATIEMGGPSGAYIDMKNPASDDYDARIFTAGTDLDITTASGAGSVNIQHETATKLNTTSTGINVTGDIVGDGLVIDGTFDLGALT